MGRFDFICLKNEMFVEAIQVFSHLTERSCEVLYNLSSCM